MCPIDRGTGCVLLLFTERTVVVGRCNSITVTLVKVLAYSLAFHALFFLAQRHSVKRHATIIERCISTHEFRWNLLDQPTKVQSMASIAFLRLTLFSYDCSSSSQGSDSEPESEPPAESESDNSINAALLERMVATSLL